MAVTIRKLVTLTPDLVNRIHDVRVREGLRSESAAMARLVESGLDYQDRKAIEVAERSRVRELLRD